MEEFIQSFVNDEKDEELIKKRKQFQESTSDKPRLTDFIKKEFKIIDDEDPLYKNSSGFSTAIHRLNQEQRNTLFKIIGKLSNYYAKLYNIEREHAADIIFDDWLEHNKNFKKKIDNSCLKKYFKIN